MQFILKVFNNFADVILLSAFLAVVKNKIFRLHFVHIVATQLQLEIKYTVSNGFDLHLFIG